MRKTFRLDRCHYSTSKGIRQVRHRFARPEEAFIMSISITYLDIFFTRYTNIAYSKYIDLMSREASDQPC
jgi:hypothetical protein